MALTDMEIRGAKPGVRLVKLSDGGGLQLWITPDGAKGGGSPTGSGVGKSCSQSAVTPGSGLREAREVREEAKRISASGGRTPPRQKAF